MKETRPKEEWVLEGIMGQVLNLREKNGREGSRPKEWVVGGYFVRDYDFMTLWFDDLGLVRDNAMIELNGDLHVIMPAVKLTMTCRSFPQINRACSWQP